MYYEAASVDGASKGTQFWQITMPSAEPDHLLQPVLQIIGAFQSSPAFIVWAGNGGPLDSDDVLHLVSHQQGFTQLDMGYASAMAVVARPDRGRLHVPQLLPLQVWVSTMTGNRKPARRTSGGDTHADATRAPPTSTRRRGRTTRDVRDQATLVLAASFLNDLSPAVDAHQLVPTTDEISATRA